jgi:hypothetical protein
VFAISSGTAERRPEVFCATCGMTFMSVNASMND